MASNYCGEVSISSLPTLLAVSPQDDIDNISLISEGEEYERQSSSSINNAAADNDNMSVAESSCNEEDQPLLVAETHINDLPDEVLESIFIRVSPYNDFDNIKCVCRKWNALAQSKLTLI